MSRRECHLELDLKSAQCGQLLSRVNDAKGLEELNLTVCFLQYSFYLVCCCDILLVTMVFFNLIICSSLKISHEFSPVCDDVTVKVVEKVSSNCRLRKMRLQFLFDKYFSWVSSHSLSCTCSITST